MMTSGIDVQLVFIAIVLCIVIVPRVTWRLRAWHQQGIRAYDRHNIDHANAFYHTRTGDLIDVALTDLHTYDPGGVYVRSFTNRCIAARFVHGAEWYALRAGVQSVNPMNLAERQVGDIYNLCDKAYLHCRDVYNNAGGAYASGTIAGEA